jgi:hypothetical protein
MSMRGDSGASSLADAVTDTVVDVAVEAGDMDLLKLWKQQGVRVRAGLPLRAAAEFDTRASATFLVQELGADVNQLCQRSSNSDTGRTPLLTAIILRKMTLAKHLVLELGADINKADDHGLTPLMVVAGVDDNLALLKKLTKHNANVPAAAVIKNKKLCSLANRVHLQGARAPVTSTSRDLLQDL